MWQAILGAIVALLKGIWGTDKPEETKVTHPEPDVKIGDGKNDKERLKDLGI